MGPSIEQRKDIDHLQPEVMDAGIGSGNGKDDVAPIFGGHPVPTAP